MLAGIIPKPHHHIQLFIIFTTAAPKDEMRVGVPCAKRYVDINVIFSMTREEKAVGREMFYTLCLRFFLSQLSKDDWRAEGLYIFPQTWSKSRAYNENSPIKASGLPFSLARAKTHPGGSSPELVQTLNLRWNEPHPLWTCSSPLIKRANHKTNLDVDTYRWVEFGRCRLGWEEHRGRDWVLLVGKLHYIIL